MAGSVNKVILVGNLGRDPETRRLSSGDPVVNFSIATSESWKDKASGERKEKTEWHNVVIYQREPRAHRRAVPEEGLQGLRRGPAAVARVHRQGRQPAQGHRGGAAAFPGRAHPARRPRRRRPDGRGRMGGGQVARGGDFGRSSPMERRPATPAPAAAGSSKRPRRRHSVLMGPGARLQRRSTPSQVAFPVRACTHPSLPRRADDGHHSNTSTAQDLAQAESPTHATPPASTQMMDLVEAEVAEAADRGRAGAGPRRARRQR